MPLKTAKQTAWANQEEFQFVYSLLYGEHSTPEEKKEGVDRIGVWLSRGSCPQAAESTAALLQAFLSDTEENDHLSVRLSYAMALTRFVNAVVDPLQTSYFARSIGAIATDIGLPLWFVELRHSATHDRLPPLVLLRSRALEAFQWLKMHYWERMLASQSGDTADVERAVSGVLRAEELRERLEAYADIEKSILKDESRANELAPERRRNIGLILGSVKEALVLAEGRSQIILEILLDVVLDPDLVTVPKKNREEAIDVFTPLLTQIDEVLDGFLDALLQTMLDLIFETEDRAYSDCLTLLCIHLSTEVDDVDGLVRTCLFSGSPQALTFLDQLMASRPDVEQTAAPLLDAVRKQTTTLSPENDLAAKLAAMEERLRSFESSPSQTRSNPQTPGGAAWIRTAEAWKPCPIGSVLGSDKDLALRE